MKSFGCLAASAAALLLVPSTAAAAAAPSSSAATPAEQATVARLRRIAESLHPVTGDVRIPQADATLHLGSDYYFLPADEARRIIVDAWGNPPQSARNVLGIVFPAGKTFADDTWGAVITYQAAGYVTDDDAESADYAALLSQLQEGEAEVNAERRQQGYPAQNLVGWAQAPTYDRATHSVVWAQNIRFEGENENGLNYDVRVLGRRGVLSLNMVTGMSRLADTRTAAQSFVRTAAFNAGARYADYQPGTDQAAGYGIATLVAAGLGATVAKKAGLIALILAFGKKIIVVIMALFAGAGAWLRRLFGRKEEEYQPAETYEADPGHDGGATGGAIDEQPAEVTGPSLSKGRDWMG